MSSILKALKKLEQEKARRADGPVDIARDILRAPVRRKKFSLLPVLILSAGIIVLAGLSGYFFHDSGDSDLASEIVPARKLTAMAPAEPAPAASEKTALQPTTGFVDPPVVEKTMETKVPAAAGQQPQGRSHAPQTSLPEKVPSALVVPPGESTLQPAQVRRSGNPGESFAGGRSEETSRLEAAPAVPLPGEASSHGAAGAGVSPEPPVVGRQGHSAAAMGMNRLPAGEHPRLVVSGIAYQGDRGSRIAVVNDLPVMEGSLVGGARVEEILSDRVKFSRDGKLFEVPLQDR
jgi:hypothetical protein